MFDNDNRERKTENESTIIISNFSCSSRFVLSILIYNGQQDENLHAMGWAPSVYIFVRSFTEPPCISTTNMKIISVNPSTKQTIPQ